MVKTETSHQKGKTRITKEQLLADRRQTRDSDSSSLGATSVPKASIGGGSDETQCDLRELSADLQAEWKKVARLTSQLGAATEENIRLRNELDSTTESLARNASAATALSSLELPQACAALASSECPLKELPVEVDGPTEKILALEIKLQASKDESVAARTKLANAQAEIARTDGEKEKALARVSELQKAVDKMERKITTLESDRTNLEGKVKGAETKQAILVKDKMALEARVATAEKRAAQPQNSEDVREIKRNLQEAYDRIDELEGTLLVAEGKPGPVGVPAEGRTAALKDKKKIAALEKSLADAQGKAKEAAEPALAFEKSLLDTLGLGLDLNPESIKEFFKEIGIDSGSPMSITSAYRIFVDSARAIERGRDALQASLAKASSAESDELKIAVAAAEKERDELRSGKKEVEDRLGKRIEELEATMDGALVTKPSPTPSVAGPSRANGTLNRVPVEMLAKQVVQLNETITQLRQENMSLLMKLAGVE